MSRQPDPAADTDGEAAEFAEVDPSGRYGKYDQILGKGAFKTVFRAFDEIDGIEVAWNQIKLNDVLRSPEDLERLYSEVHLLKSLNHKNIIKFYYSWVDTKSSNVNFITEIFTSGNLRQYRRKHRRVDMKAIKHWARQILRGLLYLHSQNPPIIHRDLKCDNIFVNGNQGEVKIGDLGLAGILRQAHPAHSVIGTPEFMAPELYEEDYNELVDIYSFGMCLLEMVTLEYPYSECVNAAQIYKKVSSGKKPAALSKVQDPQMRAFMEKCLAKASTRLPARELLMDPFLQERNPHEFKSTSEMDDFESLLGCSVPANLPSIAPESSFAYEPPKCRQHQDLHRRSRDFRVKVRRRDDDTIFLKLRIVDQEGCIRNIHFPFDVEADTALCVASEMVEELDLSDQDVTTIADMIDSEIMLLVPHWNPGACFEEHSSVNQEQQLQQHETDCDNSEIDSLSPQNQGTMHGRFEEFTYHSLPHFRPGVDDVPGEEAFSSPLEWEMSILAHKHEQELRNLQTQHDQALMELKAQYKNKRLRNNSSNFFFRSSSNCRPSLKELALCTSQVQLMDEQTCFLDDLNSSSSSSYQMKKISCGQDLQRRKQQLVEALEARSSMEGGRNSLSRSTSFSAAACQTA